MSRRGFGFWRRWGICALSMLAVGACTSGPVLPGEVPSSFGVEVVDVSGRDCPEDSPPGSEQCPLSAVFDGPAGRVSVQIEALSPGGELLPWEGAVLVGATPGQLVGVGPEGLLVQVSAGRSDVLELELTAAFGSVRIWAHDCGVAGVGGSFATGLSAPVVFTQPTLAMLKTAGAAAIVPRASNACAIAADGRFGLGVDALGRPAFVGPGANGSSGPPAPAGYPVSLAGCEDEASCPRLAVTGEDEGGFYIEEILGTDEPRGIYVPSAASRPPPGALLAEVRAVPDLEDGGWILRHASWRVGSLGAESSAPVRLDPARVAGGLDRFGEALAGGQLNALEGRLVCVDNVAPGHFVRACDGNGSGRIDRSACETDSALPACALGTVQVPRAPDCDGSRGPACVPLGKHDVEACALGRLAPQEPGELCCERACLQERDCVEATALGRGIWPGDVYGHYVQTDAAPVKLGFATAWAHPGFDPIAFGTEQRGRPEVSRQRLKIVGHLRRMQSVRPQWVVVARTQDDIEMDGTCL